MHRTGAAIGIALLLAMQALVPAPSRAGVPRSCIHPRADAIQCPRDTRRVLLDVIPSARRNALRLQRPALERTVELQSLERNELLEQILRGVRSQERQP